MDQLIAALRMPPGNEQVEFETRFEVN
jgi:hypothetical protein